MTPFHEDVNAQGAEPIQRIGSRQASVRNSEPDACTLSDINARLQATLNSG